jgi:hypothetical protein
MNSKMPVGNWLAGSRVLILKGEFYGQEGICLGKGSADVTKWAVSPDKSDQILELVFETEFGLLIDMSGNPSRN